MLNREEYIEQAYFFEVISKRLPENIPMQEILEQLRAETLATTKLPMAIDYMLAELKHSGTMYPAMQQLRHYFSPFQTYLMSEAESDRGRFDIRVAIEILQREAEYRAKTPSRQGLFMYEFEALCRNRLTYDQGLTAIANDDHFDEHWKEWILIVRRQIGIVEIADLIYARSWFFVNQQRQLGREVDLKDHSILFDEKEGKVAFANRQKDPLYLFAALQRHLGYPTVPKPKPDDGSKQQILQMTRLLEQLSQRVKLLEEEQRGGFDLSNFYKKQ